MGVPLFYRRIIQTHFPSSVDKNRPRCTTFAIDFAGILHSIYTELEKIKPEGWTVEYYVIKVFEKIQRAVLDLNVQKRLIIANDGIAPLGKMNQQRRRRFRHEKERVESGRKSNAPFDSNAISPGTDVSIEIDRLIMNQIAKHRDSLPTEVIYSGYRVPGEGEHKIIGLLNDLFDPQKNLETLKLLVQTRHNLRISNKETLESALRLLHSKISSDDFEFLQNQVNINESIVIYGLDADLIFLTLPLKQKIYLWRENISDDEFKKRRILEKNPEISKTALYYQSRRVESAFLSINELQIQLGIRKIGIPEFIFTGFLFGNDFIPYQMGFNLTSEIADTYIKILSGRRFVEPFNLLAFQEILRELLPLQEDKLFPIIAGREPVHLPKGQNEFHTEPILYPSKLAKEGQTFKDFREAWNIRLTLRLVMTDEERQEEIENTGIKYFQTLVWCYRYYQNYRDANQEWVYYPYWAPLLRDLLTIERINFEEALNSKRLRLNIMAQMLLILPRNLENGDPNIIIPKKFRVFQQPNSPIFDFYPLNFSVIKDGVLLENDGIVFLPYFDIERLVETFNKNRLTIKEKDLYLPNEEAVFKHNKGLIFVKREVKVANKFSGVPFIKNVNDIWTQKATVLFSSELVAPFLKPTEQHFINPDFYNWDTSTFTQDMPMLKVIVQE